MSQYNDKWTIEEVERLEEVAVDTMQDECTVCECHPAECDCFQEA